MSAAHGAARRPLSHARRRLSGRRRADRARGAQPAARRSAARSIPAASSPQARRHARAAVGSAMRLDDDFGFTDPAKRCRLRPDSRHPHRALDRRRARHRHAVHAHAVRQHRRCRQRRRRRRPRAFAVVCGHRHARRRLGAGAHRRRHDLLRTHARRRAPAAPAASGPAGSRSHDNQARLHPLQLFQRRRRPHPAEPRLRLRDQRAAALHRESVRQPPATRSSPPTATCASASRARPTTRWAPSATCSRRTSGKTWASACANTPRSACGRS